MLLCGSFYSTVITAESWQAQTTLGSEHCTLISMTQHAAALHAITALDSVTLFESAWNYIYLLKWSINVWMAFPGDGQLDGKCSHFQGGHREWKQM